MAFFGLTSLGPQNSFEYNSKKRYFIHLFELEDYKKAWNEIVKDQNAVDYGTLFMIIRKLFNGPVIPENDNALIVEAFREINITADFDNMVTYEEYASTLSKVKQNVLSAINGKNDENSDTKTITNEVYRENIRKHIRKSDFVDNQRLPMTGNQELGWGKQEYKPPQAGKQASEITKFAAELVKNGIYY